MKCNNCSRKAEMILQSQKTKEKVGYCRVHWLMLCTQETFKHFKLNNTSKETINKMVDGFDTYTVKNPQPFRFEDLF